MIHVYTDGACTPNPGRAGAGFLKGGNDENNKGL